MKKSFKMVTAAMVSALAATSAAAADVTLYSLDGRELIIDESEVAVYTASGMGWFAEKPVTMYSLDGRTLTVPAYAVEAHENVGWFKELPAPDKKEDVSEEVRAEKVSITLPGGPTITVPAEQVETYKTLGWIVNEEKVIVEPLPEIETDTEVRSETVTVYNAAGEKKEVDSDAVESMKQQGWYRAHDEAIYAYAAFGDNATPGAVKLMEEKKYTEALDMVQDAVAKLENTTSDYTAMIYYLRSQITEEWRNAEGAPVGFISSGFKKVDGKNAVVIELKNISNSRIKALGVNFDVCNENGDIVETNDGVYNVNNLEMKPYENKRITWGTQMGGEKYGIKNFRVEEVIFADGTVWEKA